MSGVRDYFQPNRSLRHLVMRSNYHVRRPQYLLLSSEPICCFPTTTQASQTATEGAQVCMQWNLETQPTQLWLSIHGMSTIRQHQDFESPYQRLKQDSKGSTPILCPLSLELSLSTGIPNWCGLYVEYIADGQTTQCICIFQKSKDCYPQTGLIL